MSDNCFPTMQCAKTTARSWLKFTQEILIRAATRCVGWVAVMTKSEK